MNKTLHISDSSSVHHQEFFTVNTAMVYVIQVCCVFSEKLKVDGQRNCPKHVQFYSKNKFEKLLHLVGFIIRIYARSPERQIRYTHFPNTIVVTVIFLDLISNLHYQLSVHPQYWTKQNFTCSRITFSATYTGTAFINYSTWDGRSEYHNLNMPIMKAWIPSSVSNKNA